MEHDRFLDFIPLKDDEKCEVRSKGDSWDIIEIDIPSAYESMEVIQIGEKGFEGCANLALAILPKTLRKINDRAFLNCKALESIVILPGITVVEKYLFDNCVKLKDVSIPDTVREVNSIAFMRCVSMKVVKIPSRAYVIHNESFFYYVPEFESIK